MGYLLCLEAPDASGKTTQLNLLYDELLKDGYDVRRLKFPRYGTDACKPVEMYLGGALGKNPSDTNAYAASVLFAVDRYVSYRTEWKDFLDKKNSVLLLDRYTTSNAVHQLAKLKSEDEMNAFLDWLFDLEFNKIGLPIPDDTIFLDVPPEVSRKLLANRAATDESHPSDIHEANTSYLADCYRAARFASEKKGWYRLECTENGEMRPICEIHGQLYAYVTQRIAAIAE